MLNLYQEILMDHYKNPRNRGILEVCTFTTHQRNSSCGDEITCYGVIKNNTLIDVSFDGKGCVISQATASILSEKVNGQDLAGISALTASDLSEMIGMKLGLVRIQCALLALIALQHGIKHL